MSVITAHAGTDTSTQKAWRFFIVDTAVELPTVGYGVVEADLGYAKDTDKVYGFDGAVWAVIASPGIITGTGVNDQVAVFSGTSTLDSSASLTNNGTDTFFTGRLSGVNATIFPDGDAVFGNTLMLFSERLRVVAPANSTGMLVETSAAGALAITSLDLDGTHSGTAAWIGAVASPIITQTGGSSIGAAFRSSAAIGYTGTTGSWQTFHDVALINAASGTIVAYDAFRANALKSGAGTITDMVSFRADPSGVGGVITRYYGVFISAYALPTTGIGGHFQGSTAALQVGTGTPAAPTVNGRWFNDSDMVLGGTAMLGAERLRVTGAAALVDFTSTAAFQVAQTGGASITLSVDTTNGFVGIGTIFPASPLHIANSSSNFLRFQRTSVTTRTWSQFIGLLGQFVLRDETAALDRLTVGTDGEATVLQWLQVGTVTDPLAQGDFAAGLTGGSRLVFSQAVADLTLLGVSTTTNFIAQADAAAGFTPALIDVRRASVTGGATPNSQTIGQFRFAGYDTGGMLYIGGQISGDGGVNSATGFPMSMSFKTNAGTGAGVLDALTLGTSQETTVHEWLRVGNITEGAARGDIAAGITGASRAYYIQASSKLTLRQVTITANSQSYIDLKMDNSAPSTYDSFGVRWMPNNSTPSEKEAIFLLGGLAVKTAGVEDAFFRLLMMDGGTIRRNMFDVDLSTGVTVFNEDAQDHDLRVESLLNMQALLVDAGAEFVKVGGRLRTGTATDDATQGDVVAGLTGAARIFYDQSEANLALMNSSGNISVSLSAKATASSFLNKAQQDIDLIVSTINKANMLQVDASDDELMIDGRFAFIPLTPAMILANTNDYNPESAAGDKSSFWRLSSDANRDVTGFANGLNGRLIVVTNVGSFNIKFKNENAGSVAANRFAIGADVTIGAGDTATFHYDSTTARWRIIALR